MKNSKKKKRKIKISGLIAILLFGYLIIMCGYYLFTMPVKNIIITGNHLGKDSEIINEAGISNYPSLFRINTNKLTEDIKKLPYIKNVKIKKGLNGNLTISIEEEQILFYIKLNNTYCLSNEFEIESNMGVLGLPILINYVPKDVYQDFIKKYQDIDPSVRKMISEIVYYPNVSNDVTIDSTRFLLKMNDGNQVHINIVNMEKLNKYLEVLSAIDNTEKGIFYLDSNSTNNIFKTFSSMK